MYILKCKHKYTYFCVEQLYTMIHHVYVVIRIFQEALSGFAEDCPQIVNSSFPSPGGLRGNKLSPTQQVHYS